MLQDPDTPELILGVGASWTIVIATFVIFFILVGLDVLHESKLILTSEESAWLSSQDSTSGQLEASIDDDTFVAMHRRGCFGSCPVYEVKLFGSGRVEFRGERFVCHRRPASTNVDRAAVAGLVTGLTAAGFGQMPSYTDEDATDAETVSLTLSSAGLIHTVDHYEGDVDAPRMLTWMADRIDEVANTSVWIGKTSGLRIDEMVCVLPDGSTRPLAEISDQSDS